MKLRDKTLIIIGITLIGLIGVLYFASQFILLGSFSELEEQDAQQDIARVKNALINEIDHINSLNYDWAAWDDTYEFINDGNEAYINSNLVDETFPGININLMLFINSSKNIVYGKSYDLDSGIGVPVSQGLLDQISRNDLLLQHPDTESSISGIVSLPEGPMLVSSRPIITSEAEGPIRGVLLMGRHLDNAQIEMFAGTTNLSLYLQKYGDPKAPADFQNAFITLSGEKTEFIQPLSEETITGYLLLEDIYGNPVSVLRADIPRKIHEQGQATMKYLLISIMIAGIVFGGATMLLLERSVIDRLDKLSENLGIIGGKGDLSARLSIEGDDELSLFASEINWMLSSMEKSQEKLNKIEMKNRALLDAIPDLIFQLKRDGTIFNYKSAKEEDLFVSPSIFLGRNLKEVMPAEVVIQAMHYIDEAFETNKIQIFEYQLPMKEGIREYRARLAVSGEDEIVAIIIDITEHKQAEEARRKEILIKEIHHRVKNNLQVISSLLFLQSRKIKDENIIAMFTESQNRVRSMAIAHQELYQSEDLVSIDFADYVKNLTNYLYQSYGINSNVIQLNLNISKVLMGIDTAIPLGLAINELVSNSIKHAFPEGKRGEINIDLRSEGDDYTLVIRDTGIGFPEDVDFRNTDSLGMQLVITLVEQIEGTIQLFHNGCTEFKIEFKKLKYRDRRW